MKRVITAAIIAFATLGLYPLLNDSAIRERGYDAVGGEELLLLFGLGIAAMLIFKGVKSRAVSPKANRPTTESEQSNNHYFDA